ncbi:MAG: HAD family hydrolase [Nocardioidaceae bacterium]
MPLPAGSRTSGAAAFFDLDKTIIATSSTLAFSRPFFDNGLISRTSVIRSMYAQLVYLAGGADHDQIERMRRYLTGLTNGWEAETVRQIVAETLHSVVDPLVYDEALELIHDHQARSREVVIVSTSGSDVVEPIAELLGISSVIATRLEVADGRYTGEIAFYAYGDNKATAMTELADRRGYDLRDCFAYSDSATDLPMLRAVGHPYAVNPDKLLRREAVERGWPVLDFSRPIALRNSRARQARRATMAAVAVGAGAAAAGAVAVVTRRGQRLPAK